MKKITLHVTNGFVMPSLFEEDDVQLKETALLIGANTVQSVREFYSKKLETQQELGITRDALLASQNRDLISKMTALNHEHDIQLEKMREEFRILLRTERCRIREEMSKNLDAEVTAKAEEKYRQALLTEKEKHMNEREALMLRMEERGNIQLLEARKSLECLRAEHEGLVIKLISRLESSSSRSTQSAAALGRTFEENVERHLRQVFGARSGFLLEDVHSSGHSGDLIMTFDGLRILIELKSYDPKTRVPTKEVEKLARDLGEVQPPCDAGIMISACSEITGHYSCGPLEVSSTVACVPVLFINNFLSIGEPQVTLHMTRVFLTMIQPKIIPASLPSGDDNENLLQRRTAECARRCTSYLADLSRQSTDLLKQVTTLRTTAAKLRESVVVMIETEVSRFTGIMNLVSSPAGHPEEDEPIFLDRTIFADPMSMPQGVREVAIKIASSYDVGDHSLQCPTKDLLTFIQEHLSNSSKTQKTARDALKTIFLDEVIKHGYVMGVGKREAQS